MLANVIFWAYKLLKGKKFHLAMKQCEDMVAYDTILSEGGSNIMIHHVPPGDGEGNFNVSVDDVLDEAVELPIPIKSGPIIVSDAVGTIVGWPKELLILPTKKGNLKQSGCVECGYCVIRYMIEIVLDEDPQLQNKHQSRTIIIINLNMMKYKVQGTNSSTPMWVPKGRVCCDIKLCYI